MADTTKKIIRGVVNSRGFTITSPITQWDYGWQFCYELTTPITVQLTPHEVNSLLGQNNIFADTGDTEVEYRANTVFIGQLSQYLVNT